MGGATKATAGHCCQPGRLDGSRLTSSLLLNGMKNHIQPEARRNREMYLKKRTILFIFSFVFVVGFALANFAQPQQAAIDLRIDLSYEVWKQMPDGWKTAYLLGYGHSENLFLYMLRRLLEQGTDEQRSDLAAVEKNIPHNASMGQVRDGIDEFYKDFRNRQIPLVGARRIVFLQLVGRPKAEVETALRELRSEVNK